jgi:SAM-dependent methyltransferase
MLAGRFSPMWRHRCHDDEIMEHPSISRLNFLRALSEIRWVNRYLGGTKALLDTLKKLCRSQDKGRDSFQTLDLQILDLGTGSADIPLAIAQWGQQQGHKLAITAIDSHPTAVEAAQALTAAYPEIEVRQKDALALPYAPDSFDYVVSSMFLHHLDDDDAVRLLQTMARLCRKGLIINDLERHPLAWLGIALLGILTKKGDVFRNDSRLSVLRGFQRNELERFCQEAGLHNAIIHSRFPYRWLLVWRKPQASV